MTEGRLCVYLEDTSTLHCTGLSGLWDALAGEFVVPFQNDMTAEECARIVAHALTVETEDTDA